MPHVNQLKRSTGKTHARLRFDPSTCQQALVEAPFPWQQCWSLQPEASVCAEHKHCSLLMVNNITFLRHHCCTDGQLPSRSLKVHSVGCCAGSGRKHCPCPAAGRCQRIQMAVKCPQEPRLLQRRSCGHAPGRAARF